MGQYTIVENCIQIHLVSPCPHPQDWKVNLSSEMSTAVTVPWIDYRKTVLVKEKKLSLHNNLACKLGRSINEKQTDVPYFFLAWKVLAEKGEGKDRKETAISDLQ